MRIVWLLTSHSFTHTGLGLMRMLMLTGFWQLVWRIVLLIILWSLSGLIRCGLFFIRNMSLLDSLHILLLFVRSTFFDRVTLKLMTSLISFLLFGISLTLLVLSCLLPLASLAEIRWLHLSFIGLMTFWLNFVMSLSLFVPSCLFIAPKSPWWTLLPRFIIRRLIFMLLAFCSLLPSWLLALCLLVQLLLCH
jgi:hypothetical protein